MKEIQLKIIKEKTIKKIRSLMECIEFASNGEHVQKYVSALKFMQNTEQITIEENEMEVLSKLIRRCLYQLLENQTDDNSEAFEKYLIALGVLEGWKTKEDKEKEALQRNASRLLTTRP